MTSSAFINGASAVADDSTLTAVSGRVGLTWIEIEELTFRAHQCFFILAFPLFVRLNTRNGMTILNDVTLIKDV